MKANVKSFGLSTSLVALCLCIALCASAAADAQPLPFFHSESAAGPTPFPAERMEFANPPKGDSRIPGHYIVVFKQSVEHPGNLAETQAAVHDGEIGFIYRTGLKGYSAELSKSAVEALRENSQVEYVVPDQKVELESQAIPTGIKRINDTENATADIDEKDDARVNVDVAVIDTGIDYTHPDLSVYKRTNCVPAGENTESEGEIQSCVDNTGTDGVGHGTHVAGTIGGIDNGQGVVGVAPGARLWAVRVLSNGGEGSESWIIAGVNWVTAHASEIEVANMSLGGCSFCQMPALEEAINQSIDAGVVYAVAAGNDSLPVSSASPARDPNVLTVGALADYDGKLGGLAEPLIDGGPEACQKADSYFNFGDDDRPAWFTNYGPGVDLYAPGVCILSTVPNGLYAYNSGTSMASPHVAGAAALLASKSNPNSKADVEAISQQLVNEGNQSWVNVISWHGNECCPEAAAPLLDSSPLKARTYTNRASEVSTSEATLNGGANPFGAATSYRFEYGPTTAYGTNVPATPKSIGSGTKDVALEEKLKGLKPFRTYHYRLTTINEATKAESHGEDSVFTPGVALTKPATSIDMHNARLSAAINPGGTETSYYFQWGTTTAYGQTVPSTPKSIGAGSSVVKVSQPLENLRADTTYHYRVVAVNAEGSKYGIDEQFTTSDSLFVSSVASWPESTYLKGEVTKQSSAIEFLNLNGYSPQVLFWCTQLKFTAQPFVEPVESFRATVDEAHSTCMSGTGAFVLEAPLEMHGCEFEFHPSGLDVVGAACTAITFHTWDNCTVEIGPQRGWGMYPGVNSTSWEVGKEGGFGIGSFNKPPGQPLNFTITGSLCPVSFKNTPQEEGAVGGAWGVRGTRQFGEEVKARYWTRPAITGPAATVNIDPNVVTLPGTVETHKVASTYQFEYGTTTKYGSNTTLEYLSAGETNESSRYEITGGILGGLSPSTTYHYRLKVRNDYGTFYGDDESFTTPASLPACKGTGGKCEWKAQTSPDLSKSEHSLAGVSCASSSMCMGVGNDTLAATGNAQLWDGTKWANKLTLGQSTAGISCPAVNWCMAVGVSKSAPKGFLLKEAGSVWSLETTTPPVPSGGSKAVLKGISCTATTACTAVGSYYVESEAKYKTLVERWNGTSWSTQTSTNPASGSAENAMLAVSCSSSTSCLTVGTANNAPFAESWNGTTWSTQTIPAPSPSVEATLTGISCTSSSACTAVGTNKESSVKGTYKKPLAERWNGTSWSVQTVPNPSEAKGIAKLSGVSCTTSTACTAVGLYAPVTGENPVEQRTLAESWNGTAWSVQTSPNSAQKVNGLSAVSCTSTTACTAVGAGQPVSWGELGGKNENQASLAERLSGSEWKVQETPGQSRTSYSLSNVSCAPTSSSLCLAVGADSNTGNGVGELWEGAGWVKQFGFATSAADISCPTTTWCMVVGIGKNETPQAWRLQKEGSWFASSEALPAPSGSSRVTPFAVSCSSTVSCTAVGYYHSDTEGVNRPLVEHWNGTAWSLQTAPSPPVGSAGSAMLDVSCVSSTSCLAVGNANNATFAESWNGIAWTALTPPSPGTAESTLEGVSCASPTSCKAVGSYRETGKGQYKKPLAVRWNSTEWALLTTPSPSEAKGDTTLRSVSCSSPTYCTAVGQYSPEASSTPLETRSLAEYWDGNAWAVQNSPNSTQKQNALSGVSCSSSIACTAVGSGSPEWFALLSQAALVERYE